MEVYRAIAQENHVAKALHWKYEIVDTSCIQAEASLPDFDAEGWEIVAVTFYSHGEGLGGKMCAMILRRDKSLDDESRGTGALYKFQLQQSENELHAAQEHSLSR